MTTPALQDLTEKSFVKGAHRPGGDVRRLYHRETGDWQHNTKRIYEVDRERFAGQKVEGQGSVRRGIAQGYFKDIERKTISITREVSGEQFKALTAHKLAEWATMTGKDVVDKIELDMRNFLGYSTVATSYTDNEGFTIDVTVGDALAVFNATHLLKYSATTYSNILSGNPVLTNVGLEAAEDFFNYNVMDNYGQRISMTPNTLITAPKATMVNRAKRWLGSDAPESLAGTANANAGVKNTYKNKYTHLVIDFDVNALNQPDSNKSFYWFMAALGGTPEESWSAYYVSWMSPMVAPLEVDQDKWILSFTARACYGIGAVSGKGIVVSKATS